MGFVLHESSKKKGVNLKHIAGEMGLSHMVLLNKLNPNKPGTHLSPEELNHFIAFAGLDVIEEIANQHGKTLKDLMVVVGNLRSAHFEAEKEHADVVLAKSAFFADGVLEKKELAKLIKEKREQMEADEMELNAMVFALNNLADGEKVKV